MSSIQVISISKSVIRTANQGSAEVFIPNIPDGYKLICACGFSIGSANLRHTSMCLTNNDTVIRMDIYNPTSSTITATCTACGLIIKK